VSSDDIMPPDPHLASANRWFDTLDKMINAIAAELCPEGPRAPTELARTLGFPCEPAELPAEIPVLLLDDAILYRLDERQARSILEGCAAAVLLERGLHPNPTSVAALVARLISPATRRGPSASGIAGAADAPQRQQDDDDQDGEAEP
jgi:hypothetical protein